MTQQNKPTVYASPALRLMAHIFDLLLGWFTLVVLFYMVSGSNNYLQLLNNSLLGLIVLLIVGLVGGIIYSFMTANWGGTPGKLIYGIKVIQYDGTLLSFKKALFRNYVARSVSNLFFGFGYFWIFKDVKKQTWHDMTIDSYVIKYRDNFWIFGIITTILLFGLIGYLAASGITNITSNADIYAQIFS